MKPLQGFAVASLWLVAVGCGDAGSRSTERLEKPSAMDLQRYRIDFETATVSVLSAGPLERRPFEIPFEQESLLLNSEYFTYSKLPEVEVVVSWVRAREGFPANLRDGIEQHMSILADVPGVDELNYQTREATVSGLPAIRGSATWHTQDGERAAESVIFGKNNEAWLVNAAVALRDKEVARRIVESVEAQTQVAEEQEAPARRIERTSLKVTLEGKIYLNDTEASFEEVKQELERLRQVNGVVLYFREGGASPPPAAESISGAILFEISKADIPFVWAEEIDGQKNK
jgi:hypothetical protein